jgi:hypothetical protein
MQDISDDALFGFIGVQVDKEGMLDTMRRIASW